jgi:hypothetical protein
VLSGRGLCDELITRPEESYQLWRVVCDKETALGCRARENNNNNNNNNKPANCLTSYDSYIGS